METHNSNFPLSNSPDATGRLHNQIIKNFFPMSRRYCYQCIHRKARFRPRLGTEITMVRIKHRYILGEVKSGIDLNKSGERGFINLVTQQIRFFHGEYGVGALQHGMRVIYLNPSTGTFLLKTARSSCRAVWSSLTLTRERGNQSVQIVVLHVSGTIKQAKEAALQYNQNIILVEEEEKEEENI
ncbi:RNase P and RNase MRP subunit (predicted) [Planoprotostelium fungivorum]|uniref:RNase P and RNase MRP subunit (Predicted) n=1 Tax=Planoprotostelium fungivorum TaxID=1890364 RepID=A0A2P6NYA2_9EUKA|nr:RNase P and RNase MRP subunit (predicted) [Planoprotostelium fungivorum]